MAQQSYRANLSASIYPMALSRAGRSVIVPQIDQNYDRRVDPTGEQKTPGIPQALYLENVLPTVEGYQSVGLASQGSFSPASNRAGRVEIRDADNGLIHVFFRDGLTTGMVFQDGTWRNLNVAGAAGKVFLVDSGFSSASIRGKTYIFNAGNLFELISDTFLGVPIFELQFIDDTAGTGAALAPLGVLVDTVAIGSSFGYLLLMKRNSLTGKDTSVVWSSLLDETDFAPSLVTGAGGGAIETIEGTGKYLLGTSYGFRIYADNLVEAAYTGNPRYPFRFSGRDLDSVPLSREAIYGQRDSDTHLMISKNRGILGITQQGADRLAPELAEFLERFRSGKDIFDAGTNTFSVTSNAFETNTAVSIYALGNKYICVSTGDTPATYASPQLYTECYVFDISLNRYGKIKVQHTHVMESRGASAGFNTLVFVDTSSGVTQALILDTDSATTHSGVLLLGKFQGVRSRRIILEEIELESAGGTKEACSLHILPSEDGKNFSAAVTPYEKAMSSKEVKQYFTHTEGKNICLLIKGQFALSTVQINFHLGGHS